MKNNSYVVHDHHYDVWTLSVSESSAHSALSRTVCSFNSTSVLLLIHLIIILFLDTQKACFSPRKYIKMIITCCNNVFIGCLTFKESETTITAATTGIPG